MVSVEVVLFAIQAGIRLGKEARRAYVDSTRSNAIALPLPDVSLSPDINSAFQFFSADGKEFVDSDPVLATLHTAVRRKIETPEQTAQYMSLYEELFTLVLIRKGRVKSSDRFDADAFTASVTFRQWQRGDPNEPKPGRRFAGVLVEIGIDYFAAVPGALNKNSKYGKVVASFVDALDKIEFSEVLAKQDPLRLLVGRLFVAALETISEQSEILSSDANVQELLKVATAGLATDIGAKLADTDSIAQMDRIGDWGELVFRSVLTTAGKKVLQDPKRFLGVGGAGESALVTKIGISLIDLATNNEDLDLTRVFGRAGLDSLMRSALEVVGDHPELVASSNTNGLQALISGVASELAGKKTLLEWGVLPDVARIVLDKTGDNLALLWPELASNPQKRLLLTAATTTLDILSREPTAGAKWQLRFGRADALAVMESVIDEFASNPQWVIDAAGNENRTLGKSVEAAMAVLRKRGDQRLGKDLAKDILEAGIRAATLNSKLLDPLPGKVRPLFAEAIDIALTAIFDDSLPAEARFQLLARDTVSVVVEVSMDSLAGSKLDAAALKGLKECIGGAVDDVVAGGTFDLGGLEACLTAKFQIPGVV